MKNNKGFIGLGLILAIIAVLAVGGGAYYLGTKNISVSKNTVVDNSQTVPAENQNIDSTLKSNIESFLINGPYKPVNKNDKVTCKITLYGYENNFAYTFSSCSEFDNNQKLITGGSFPARFKYDSLYKIISYNEAADGEGYRDSVKELFPVKFQDFIISRDEPNMEDISSEIFNKQPGAIKSITAKGNNQWTLAVDLLSINHKWVPGDDSGPYVNQNTKIRNLLVTKDTKTYNCGADQKPDVLQNAVNYITNVQKNITQAKSDIKGRIGGPVELMTDWRTLNFDINGTNITAIYDICLP